MSVAVLLAGCRTESTTVNLEQPSLKQTTIWANEPPADPKSEEVIISRLEDDSDHQGEADSTLLKLTDTDLVNVFKTAFQEAEPIHGVVKSKAPSHMVLINKTEYDLWIDDGKTGTIARAEESHTLYSMSLTTTLKIKEILSWSVPQKPVQGLVMDKKIHDDSLRILVATNWTGHTQNISMDDRIKKSYKTNEHAWYTVSQEFYVQAHVGQQVSIIAAAQQLESNPPIRFSITARLIEPLINKSSFYLKLVEEELNKQQLLLISIDIENEWVLEGITPSRYTVDHIKNDNKSAIHEQLSIYVFNSEEHLEAGLDDFHKQTALMDMLYPRIYKINNVMLFYWARGDMDKQAIFGPSFDKAAEQLLLK
ncbi:hypothetical protein [Paenibacillus sp. LHD-38]|uniref:hypothetical protein n=1 Tax=Paenibacillus sp. LHD-38 TaxID=3072143 RepID=UPI00280C7D76|nr:hypothetical protein [Paenibacillus sp. LHD-38]MDQ8735726.1 hypothetical protein [Paenibacillus sp. LHD-38]